MASRPLVERYADANRDDDEDSRLEIGRRVHERLKMRVPAELVLPSGACPIVIVDLSRSGARVETKAPLPSGTLAEFRFGDLSAACTVRWGRGKFCGLEFDRFLSADVLSAISEADLAKADDLTVSYLPASDGSVQTSWELGQVMVRPTLREFQWPEQS